MRQTAAPTPTMPAAAGPDLGMLAVGIVVGALIGAAAMLLMRRGRAKPAETPELEEIDEL